MTDKRHVQAFGRGLDVLAFLNTHNGASIGEVAAGTGINRGIVYRLLETLRHKNFVRKDSASSAYWLTESVRNLADGFDDEDWIDRIAKPAIGDLGREVVWPISVSTVSGVTMLVRATSDYESPLVLNRFPAGFRFPLISSAAGQAYLAFCSAQQRKTIIEVVGQSARPPDDFLSRSPQLLEGTLKKVKTQGYALVLGQRDAVSALAVPIRSRDLVFGSLSLRYFDSAMRPKSAVEQYFAKLKSCAGSIAEQLRVQ